MIIISSMLNAILYRLGGYGKPFNTKFRDWGCPLITLGTLFIMGVSAPWWVWVLSFLLLFGALTTYWDTLLGYDNFYLHGFMCGLGFLPFMVVIPWYLIVLRAVVIGVFMGLLCKYFINDIVEEGGRGASLSFTLPILFIGV